MLFVRLVAGLVLFAGMAACAPAPAAPEVAIYGMVLESVRDEVHASGPVLLHPLLIQRPEGDGTLDRGTFNAFDSATAPEVARLDDRTELCPTNEAGSCVAPTGGVAIALSEMVDLGADGVGVGALVTDGREGASRQRFFMVRAKARSRGWEVVGVRRVH